jgi:hypothetical protein
LQLLFSEVIKEFDCTILEGHRGESRQNEMYRTGRSKAKYGESLHNINPSSAIDVAPYPIDWNDRERFTYFAGYVKGKAAALGIKIRWGGDWDGDWQVRDNNFDDLPHFELVD